MSERTNLLFIHESIDSIQLIQDSINAETNYIVYGNETNIY